MKTAIPRVLAAAALVLGTTVGAAPFASATEVSMVSVVHGIPDQPVDVYVNGAKTLDKFEPSTVAGPLELAAGTYDVALTKPGEPVGSAILRNQALSVPGGKNLSLAAHLDAAAKPVLTAFVNDTAAVAAGQARLIVRHAAAAPAVDVRAGGQPVFTGLTNPNEAKADLPAGAVEADVVLAGTSTVVLGPQSVNLKAGSATIVYAIGSAEGKTLGLASQVVDGLGGAPTGMPAGTGGAADTSAPWPLLSGSALLLVAATAALRRRSARPAGDVAR